MKYIYILVSFLLVIGLSSFFQISNIDSVINGIKTGNALQVARYFDNTVEITMPEKSNSYSKSQAELVLKDFFATNVVNGFEIIHKGENAGSQYCIGTLNSKYGGYRTTIFMKKRGEVQVLQELRFENR